MLIAAGNLKKDSLAGLVAIVTGAGGGIGYEAARALLWLGCQVVIAEIDASSGQDAELRLASEWPDSKVVFIPTDVGNEGSVRRLYRQCQEQFGWVSIIINNATIAPLGSVTDVPIGDWDKSYRVNLRGPVLLAQTFIPHMLANDYGVFVTVSSTGLAYMGAYELFKKAQVDLATTLDAEMTGTGVHCFCIGPGAVPTETFSRSIKELARLHNEPEETFLNLVRDHMISIEAAGTGFAAAVAMAERYRGQEISSFQALIDAGIPYTFSVPADTHLNDEDFDAAAIDVAARRVRDTFAGQVEGWKQRSLFERQWILRDFKKRAGLPVEQWQLKLDGIVSMAEAGDSEGLSQVDPPLSALGDYYRYMSELARGYTRDQDELEVQIKAITAWIAEVDELDGLLDHKKSSKNI